MAMKYNRDPMVRSSATIAFAVAIAGVGAVMMGLTSSPSVKGAALLWIPAALQLMAGVWLGPWQGFLAGGIGAQAAGVIAYGGWGPSDWIMNFVAGGVANALLPALLFQLFSIDPAFRTDEKSLISPVGIAVLLVLVVIAAFVQRPLFATMGVDEGRLGYAIPMSLVLLAPLVIGTGLLKSTHFYIAAAIVVFSCLISAIIGVIGSMVAGQSLAGAITTVGIGWFFGDSISALIGLYALASLTPWARERGFASLPR